ncbi:MAG: hypothetical protein LBM41_06735 [Ruminococcus sp.]|jgi:O-acetyl-ADP-ribose deacetylase (regulator of RNase III)|nr:hypothetical protein [Ruminococcus sp.]
MPFKIIHAASLIYRGGGHGEEKLLRDTYMNTLKCAVENGLKKADRVDSV